MARCASSRARRVKLALDTNAYKALGEGNQQLAEEARTAEAVGLPMIVLGELWFGFINVSLREDTVTQQKFLRLRFMCSERALNRERTGENNRTATSVRRK